MIFSNTSVLISGKVAEPSFDSAKEPRNVAREKKKEKTFWLMLRLVNIGARKRVRGWVEKGVLGVLEQ